MTLVVLAPGDMGDVRGVTAGMEEMVGKRGGFYVSG